MAHTWITSRAEASTQNLLETVKELTKMQAKKRLKKAIFTVVAANRLDRVGCGLWFVVCGMRFCGVWFCGFLFCGS